MVPCIDNFAQQSKKLGDVQSFEHILQHEFILDDSSPGYDSDFEYISKSKILIFTHVNLHF